MSCLWAVVLLCVLLAAPGGLMHTMAQDAGDAQQPFRRLRIAVIVTGQLARMEVKSKLNNVILSNLKAGHVVHLFLSLDNDVNQVKQTQFYSQYNNTPWRHMTKRTLRSHLKSAVAIDPVLAKRFRTFISLKTYPNSYTAINGPSRMDKMWNGLWDSDPHRVTPEKRFDVNMRMLMNIRDGVRQMQETEVRVGPAFRQLHCYTQRKVARAVAIVTITTTDNTATNNTPFYISYCRTYWSHDGSRFMDGIQIYLGRFYNLVARVREDSFFYGPWLIDSAYQNAFTSLNVNSFNGVNDHDFVIDRKFADRFLRGLSEEYFADWNGWGRLMKHSTEVYMNSILDYLRVRKRKVDVCTLPSLPLRGLYNETHWALHRKYADSILMAVNSTDSLVAECFQEPWVRTLQASFGPPTQ